MTLLLSTFMAGFWFLTGGLTKLVTVLEPPRDQDLGYHQYRPIRWGSVKKLVATSYALLLMNGAQPLC